MFIRRTFEATAGGSRRAVTGRQMPRTMCRMWHSIRTSSTAVCSILRISASSTHLVLPGPARSSRAWSIRNIWRVTSSRVTAPFRLCGHWQAKWQATSRASRASVRLRAGARSQNTWRRWTATIPCRPHITRMSVRLQITIMMNRGLTLY